MAYERNLWENGDVVTAEKLNNLEAGSVMIVTITGEYVTDSMVYSADHTAKEIFDASHEGIPVFAVYDDHDPDFRSTTVWRLINTTQMTNLECRFGSCSAGNYDQIITQGLVITGKADGTNNSVVRYNNTFKPLPSVSSTDNGKALVVDDGEWTVGSTSAVFEIGGIWEYNYDAHTATFTADKKASEIYDAFKAGKVLYLLNNSSVTNPPMEDFSRFIVDRVQVTKYQGNITCNVFSTAYATAYHNIIGDNTFVLSASASNSYPTYTGTYE